jgi:2OG-Fe(II) oxygenase superfamily
MTILCRNIRLLAAFLASTLAATATASTNRGMLVRASEDQSRKVELVNESGKRLVVDWINPASGEIVPLAEDFPNGAKQFINSFVNHTLLIHEPTTSPTCDVSEDGCGVGYITVSENKEHIVVVKRDMQVDLQKMDNRAKEEAKSVTDACREAAAEDLQNGEDAKLVMDDLVDCLGATATKLIQQKSEQVAFESKVRLELSAEMENHTCSDPLRETSTPVEIRSWTHEDTPGHMTTRQISVLHDRASSQIHALENFISKEECDAITEAAAKKLHRGTVADGSGGSRLSDHRKAWQAAITIPWDNTEDLITRVTRRIYDYTNDAVHYNLTIDGQEDLMSIQYFGQGKDSLESPDQYRPHCDGDCDGLLHKKGGRVATMVMYCDAPQLGGGTNFQNSNVFVKPKVGSAAFFSYLNAETMHKETGFTTHSGCPVIEGTKRIAVHWMRYGVDSENPWDSFNTLTIKREEEEC